MERHETLPRILQIIEPHLAPPPTGSLVIMLCGIAGAGKSTLAQALVSTRADLRLTRLSIDGLVFARHGIYGVDYAADGDIYAAHQTEAAAAFEAELRRLLGEGANVVLDRSYFARCDREVVREMVRAATGKTVLVYLKAERGVLWRRIRERASAGKTADSALDIDEALLDRYVEGFEEPEGEGEIVVEVQIGT